MHQLPPFKFKQPPKFVSPGILGEPGSSLGIFSPPVTSTPVSMPHLYWHLSSVDCHEACLLECVYTVLAGLYFRCRFAWSLYEALDFFPISSLLQTQELKIFTHAYKEVMKLSQLCAILFIYSIQLGKQ